jgi:lactate 2-monooxygenase
VTEQPFANFQNEVYLNGLFDQRPELPFDLPSLERIARERLDDGAYGYVAGGSSSEDTMAENLAAFRRWRIVPRMLRDVGERHLGCTVLGQELPSPVVLAPVGVQGIIHPDGELAAARAAAALGQPMCVSTASSHTLEDIAEVLGDTPRWFQLYWPSDDDLARSFVSRAEAAGYSALVVTLDTWLLGWRPRDLNTAYLPFLRAEGVANYFADPVFRAGLEASPEEDQGAAVLRFVGVFSDPTVTWERLSLLREHTDLPIVLKGILDPDDAERAADAGVQGIIVSNHGGRQVDGAIATLDALPAIAERVGDRVDVLLDSGIRTGSDAVKALCLGAKAVLLGRPYLWGLAAGGEDGVRQAVRGFLADLDLALALSGNRSLADLSPELLRRVGG